MRAPRVGADIRRNLRLLRGAKDGEACASKLELQLAAIVAAHPQIDMRRLVEVLDFEVGAAAFRDVATSDVAREITAARQAVAKVRKQLAAVYKRLFPDLPEAKRRAWYNRVPVFQALDALDVAVACDDVLGDAATFGKALRRNASRPSFTAARTRLRAIGLTDREAGHLLSAAGLVRRRTEDDEE